VVTVQDPNWGPLPHRPLYIGQTGDLSERPSLDHEKFPDWARAAHGKALYASYFVILPEQERKAAEKQLIEHYNPECNITYNRNNAIAARIFDGTGALQNAFGFPPVTSAPFPRLTALRRLKDLM
jgi:hypothetical protein